MIPARKGEEGLPAGPANTPAGHSKLNHDFPRLPLLFRAIIITKDHVTKKDPRTLNASQALLMCLTEQSLLTGETIRQTIINTHKYNRAQI